MQWAVREFDSIRINILKVVSSDGFFGVKIIPNSYPGFVLESSTDSGNVSNMLHHNAWSLEEPQSILAYLLEVI